VDLKAKMDSAKDLHDQGMKLASSGKYDKATMALEEALRLRRSVLGPEHRDTAETATEITRLLDIIRTAPPSSGDDQAILAESGKRDRNGLRNRKFVSGRRLRIAPPRSSRRIHVHVMCKNALKYTKIGVYNFIIMSLRGVP